ncbi:hypothetical protein HIM_04479 [Hirsutella minnesotensis 3608]|uniref:S-adenosylmethionine-dependent methyltransferase-like protein n=1 Tax=Hirsutella minnesotensis 3608 TaxID=1043627 RepID=A0A0F7ZV55_9HYPO|nr:hypothetical protein HIM_04479 [Hirsutella minnesotensis 3608]
MPSFVGRLSKHSNRSQHAIAELPLPASASGIGADMGLGGGGSASTGPGTNGGAAAASAASAPAPAPAPPASTSAPPAAARGRLPDSPAEANPPPPMPVSSTVLGSGDPFVVDQVQSRSSQLRQTPPHLYHLPPGGANHLVAPSQKPLAIDPSPPTTVFDGRQQPQTPVDPASRSQSPHYGTALHDQHPPPPLHHAHQHHHPDYHLQHHLAYGIPSPAVDPAATPSALQQQAHSTTAVPEKRSTRKLIKGIFSSAGRNSHDSPHHQNAPPPQVFQSAYDNTTGLARRPSKRNSRVIVPNTSIRPVPGEHLELSSYEDELYQPPDHPPPNQHQHQQHPLQRRGTLRVHEPQILYDPLTQQTAPYDQHSTQPNPPTHSHPVQHYPSNPSQVSLQQYSDSRISPSHHATASQQPQQNPETISQLSHESLVADPDQLSLLQQQPSGSYSNQGHDATTAIPKLPPIQTSSSHSSQEQHSAMVPPAGAPASSRRTDTDKALRAQAEPPSGPPPGYRHGSISMNPISPLPAAAGQSAAFRSDRSQFEGSAGADQGRSSPQPSNLERDADAEKQFKDLLTKYKNVKRLYFDGKSQIEQLAGQVEQLQNAVANQRMSQSRTAWDDNEYMTRFNRLNGAINNLSFNIRKDWRTLPQWLDNFVSPDALKTGKQEMTAVGRAVLSRWMIDELFNNCFHPALDTQLSSQLKEIELSIRGNAYTMHSQEEFDALTTKIVNWRMATLDGLQHKLNSPAAEENRSKLIARATKNLTAYLHQHLSNPPPPGLEGSTSMIVELAVAIATNLPIESRDVAIMYPLPGDAVQEHLMEVEKTGLPTLDSQKTESEEVSEEDEEAGDTAERDKSLRIRGEKGKPGTLAFKSCPASRPERKSKGGRLNKSGSDMSFGTGSTRDAGTVRFAGFVALEVRGRQVLMKAPVWIV